MCDEPDLNTNRSETNARYYCLAPLERLMDYYGMEGQAESFIRCMEAITDEDWNEVLSVGAERLALQRRLMEQADAIWGNPIDEQQQEVGVCPSCGENIDVVECNDTVIQGFYLDSDGHHTKNDYLDVPGDFCEFKCLYCGFDFEYEEAALAALRTPRTRKP